MKNTFSLLLLFCLSIFLSSSGHALEKDTIRFGVASVISPGESYSQYSALSDYLGKKLSMKVAFFQKDSYAKMNTMIREGEVDVATVCTGALLDLNEKDYKVLAIPVVRGKSSYNSYVIVSEKSGIKSVDELKGQTFAFTDSLSNSGALYPTYLVTKNTGKTPERYFSKVYYTGNHDKSIFLVNSGVVAGAAVDSLIFEYFREKYPEKVANIRIIDVSPEFLAPPIVASGKVSEKLFKKMQNALTNMHKDDDGRKILGGILVDRLIPPDSHSLDSMIEMKKFLDAHSR
ncbi:MAG: phosphate/phosphite/phosphonate ABC transporter substrate-binding protein [Deferribacterales bacterium]